jgi:hypothetical protein
LSLCLTKHHPMKTYWGSGGIAPRILDLGTRWRWVVSFTPRPLYSQWKSPRYPLGRRLGGPSAVLDVVVKRQIPSLHRESNRRTAIVHPVAQRSTTELSRLSSYLQLIHLKNKSDEANDYVIFSSSLSLRTSKFQHFPQHFFSYTCNLCHFLLPDACFMCKMSFVSPVEDVIGPQSLCIP